MVSWYLIFNGWHHHFDSHQKVIFGIEFDLATCSKDVCILAKWCSIIKMAMDERWLLQTSTFCSLQILWWATFFLHSQLTYRFKPINSCVYIERSLWNGGVKIWRYFSKVTLLNSNKKWNSMPLRFVLSSKVHRFKVFLT